VLLIIHVSLYYLTDCPARSNDANDIGRFLNRILGLEVLQQELLVESFNAMLERKMRDARRSGASEECIFEQTGRQVKQVRPLSLSLSLSLSPFCRRHVWHAPMKVQAGCAGHPGTSITRAAGAGAQGGGVPLPADQGGGSAPDIRGRPWGFVGRGAVHAG
jgi:hypothetical protein